MRNTASTLRHLAVGFCLCLLALLAVPAVSAQETTAAIQGTVTDPTGAVVAGATVTATSDSLPTPATATTDGRGFYRLNALPPGTYTISVEGSGMSAKATNVKLAAGELPNLNLKAAVGASTVIDVTDSLAQVDVTQSKVETVVTNEILQEIPKGRNFQSVIPFTPGARQEPLQSTSSNRSNGYQIDGASDSENVYASDGVNITSIQAGGVGFTVPVEFVDQVQVKSSSFEAEYGGALGGVVNVIQPKGGSNWHGSIFGYYRSSALNANDQCNFQGTSASLLYNTSCGLRAVPGTSSNSGNRSDASYEYYIAQQDHYRQLDPGFTLGGPLISDKLRMFASYVPSFNRVRRDATFTGTNPGPRQFYQNTDTHLGLLRFDYSPFSKLRLFANWQNAYQRSIGQLPNPQSKIGQANSSAGTDPTTFRADTGTASPGSIYSFGGDYTITSNTLISARYGYTFSNTHTLGSPSGLRYQYSGNVSASTTTLNPTGDPTKQQTFGAAGVPSTFYQTSGFQNIGANQPTFFNAYTRKQFSVDVSTLKTGWAGTHNFKGGYALNNLGNNVKTLYDYAYVIMYYGQPYSPQTSPSACDAIITANQQAYGQPVTQTNPNGTNNATAGCRGQYGYFIVRDGTDVIGKVSSKTHGLYIQDAWTLGRTGLTINAGVRFDKEYLPPYTPTSPSISFGFADKVAPRIGGAYDLLHNGKVKVYASYGQFFDIMKYSLPQGSFGGNYWHDCVYTLDKFDYNTIQPTAPAGADGYRHSCPTTGLAPGVPANAASDTSASGGAIGRFIENNDLRATNNSSDDPGVDRNIKPMKQHEYVVGGEWAITPTLTFTGRYARKRLDNTIEDMGVNDNYGYYIGNPGSAYGDLLHRALPNIYRAQVTSGAMTAAKAAGFLNPAGICPNCPYQPKATRRYDGVEFRITKVTNKYFVQAFYTYSKLTGNYPGLTTTYITDGSGGRHNPNNNRSFDYPQMQFDTHGNPLDGPLPTDRPNTFGAWGSYRLRTLLGESQLGLSQAVYQGSPVSTCVGTISSSACQFAENQGNFTQVHRDPATSGPNVGNLVLDGVAQNYRTPAYTQTDLNLTHYVHVSKEHENRKIGAELNVQNAFNQHAVMAYVENLTTTAYSIASTDTNNPTGADYQKYMTGWDYIATANSSSRILSNQYGKPNLFQAARQLRIKVAYVF
ncbi:carboxypeptidase regulatory-like domain-containing protein [Terriglobus sp. 2YAB30_2]|uniref:carboxypeptidase regulatory-like domain-containing protein n=1 Tax=Terriglobus sp. 2YAB30_2 TaxID=3233023 RepID=UPI003F94BB2F